MPAQTDTRREAMLAINRQKAYFEHPDGVNHSALNSSPTNLWRSVRGRAAFKTIEKHFKIEKVQGIYGASKWAIPVALLSPASGLSAAKLWHETDLRKRTTLNRLGSSLHVSLLLEAR